MDEHERIALQKAWDATNAQIALLQSFIADMKIVMLSDGTRLDALKLALQAIVEVGQVYLDSEHPSIYEIGCVRDLMQQAQTALDADDAMPVQDAPTGAEGE